MKGNVVLKPFSIASVQVERKKIFSIARSPAQAWRAKASPKGLPPSRARGAQPQDMLVLFLGRPRGNSSACKVHAILLGLKKPRSG